MLRPAVHRCGFFAYPLPPCTFAVLVGSLAVLGCGRTGDTEALRPPVADPAPPPPKPEERKEAKDAKDAGAVSGPRVYARTRYLFVHVKPHTKSEWIGHLSVSGSTPLKSAEPVAKLGKDDGCGSVKGKPPAAFYAVEPRGYVCVDGVQATFDESDPVVVALKAHAPRLDSPWPYEYGESKGLKRIRSLASVTTPAWPLGLQDWREDVQAHNTVAWTDELKADGKDWLWGSDVSFLPKADVTPYAKYAFTGIHLDGDKKLPVAFVRGTPRDKLRREGPKKFVKTGDTWDRHAIVELTGATEPGGGARLPPETMYETKENGVWIAKHDATIVEPQAKPPWTGPARGRGDRRHWLEVSAIGGWLIAYEDEKPVFATLISAGKLGAVKHVPHEPQPPATTPLGSWNIDTKFLTTTLVSGLDDGSDYIHQDVPWSQRFLGIYLLHTAYWHDQWGEGRSGGCVNMAPTDAKWLFEFTDPVVPPGWHSVRRVPGDEEPSSMVVLHP
jgi:L,D-transpeptidase catalytic domain